MLRTKIDDHYCVSLPEDLRLTLKVGDELLIMIDEAGRIVLIPESRVFLILENTSGMWSNRSDFPTNGIEYVNQLRKRRRLNEQQETEYDCD